MVSDEEAKAVQELAKTVQKGLGTLERVGTFLGPVGTELTSWAQEALQSRRNLWRYKNMLAVLDKVEEINRERRLEGKPIPIPPRQAVPLLEAIGEEDDETIQSMWGALIANATRPGGQEINRMYVGILRAIDPAEAVILRAMGPVLSELKLDEPGKTMPVADLANLIGSDERGVVLALYHLTSLGCFRLNYPGLLSDETGVNDPWPSVGAGEVLFTPTQLAAGLLIACRA